MYLCISSNNNNAFEKVWQPKSSIQNMELTILTFPHDLLALAENLPIRIG